MRTRIEVASHSGIVVVADAATVLPAGVDQEPLLRELEPLARAGGAFYLVTDDPVDLRIDVITEEPSDEVDPELEPLGGVFRLRAPSGRVSVSGWERAGAASEAGAVAVMPGTYSLVVFGRRPFDGARHSAEMSALLGPEWAYMQKVDRLGLIGCLPLILAAIAAAMGRWSWMWVIVPMLLVTWVPSLVLRSGRRYKAAERRSVEHDRARPSYALRLSPTADETLPGGFIRV